MAGIRIRPRSVPTMHPFRPAQTTREAMLMQDALEQAMGSGDDALAREIAAAIRMSDVDPGSVGVMRALRSLEREPMEVLPQRSFEDMGQEIGKSVRSHEGLLSGRTANLRNQPYARPAGAELRAAAEEAIRGRQQSAASENLGRSAALLGAGGLAGMIADTAGRMQQSPPGIQDFASEAMDDSALLPDPAPMAMPEPEEPAIGDLTFEDPMDTANLVAESRPIPDSTPMALIRANREEEAASPPPKMTAAQFVAQAMADIQKQTAQLNDLRRQRAISPEQDRMLSQEIASMVQLVNEARAPSRMR